MSQWFESLQHSDPLVLGVLYLLVALSVLTWSIIIYKALELWRAGRANKLYAQQFWQDDFDILKEGNKISDAGGPFAFITAKGLEALQHYQKYPDGPSEIKGSLSDVLTRVLRQSIQDCTTRLESGIGLLATVGNTAPFIGLFGTVVGIMSALKGISQSGAAGLDVVAGPIGEALIATAAGLACAIPAVIAYNSFVRRLRVLGNGMDGFAHDVLIRLSSEAAERSLVSAERR
ncbi:MAG: MotA/TolQ/ExbB proton channel family protein [Nitrospirae bacterium]|nr:MotA/TolQ/ExbB proton channel family protein [Candidatus Manganitrophaceae bacterium]